jgi:hypothetical protein
MKTSLRPAALAALCALLAATGTARANDFPTVDRVLYVQECMRVHPGPGFEMTNKCSCALDALAKELPYDDYVTISTVSKALSIGGERGGAIRDAPSLEPQAKRYRELQAKAESGCFLRPAGR